MIKWIGQWMHWRSWKGDHFAVEYDCDESNGWEFGDELYPPNHSYWIVPGTYSGQ